VAWAPDGEAEVAEAAPKGEDVLGAREDTEGITLLSFDDAVDVEIGLLVVDSVALPADTEGACLAVLEAPPLLAC
jgi:hypothetical protein